MTRPGMARYVMKLEGLIDGPPTEFDGEYLKRYDPGYGPPGECLLDTVKDPRHAKKYPDVLKLLEEWNRVDPRQPVRADGLPNKPLTAFSVSAEPYPAL